LTFDRSEDNSDLVWSNDGRRIQLIQNVNMLPTPNGEVLWGNSLVVDTHDTGFIFGKLIICFAHVTIYQCCQSLLTALAPLMGLAIRLASSCADGDSEEQARLEVSCAVRLDSESRCSLY
jgi:hypothetical protein